MNLYYNIINIDKANYIPCWNLYIKLIETIDCPKNIDFYDWESINIHPDSHLLCTYKQNIRDCMHVLIPIVENIVRNITNTTPGYNICDDAIYITNYMITCTNCGRVWDGYAQCDCVV